MGKGHKEGTGGGREITSQGYESSRNGEQGREPEEFIGDHKESIKRQVWSERKLSNERAE